MGRKIHWMIEGGRFFVQQSDGSWMEQQDRTVKEKKSPAQKLQESRRRRKRAARLRRAELAESARRRREDEMRKKHSVQAETDSPEGFLDALHNGLPAEGEAVPLDVDFIEALKARAEARYRNGEGIESYRRVYDPRNP
jgi:hypothetical protein